MGIQSDYRGEQTHLTSRRGGARKSQKNLNPQLSDEQKAANTALSRVGIFIRQY